MSEVLDIWVVYFNVPEYPGKYILKRDRAMGPPLVGDTAWMADSLTDIRVAIPQGLTWMPRQNGDHQTIVETWF